MIKLIVSDLDGTLLQSATKTVTLEDQKAVQDALNNDVQFCLASGRKDIDMKEVSKLLGGTFYRVSQNGAFIFSDQDENIHYHTFQPDIAKMLYEHLSPHDVISFVSSVDKEYVEKKTDQIFQIEKGLFSPIEEQPELVNEFGQSIHPSKLVVIGDGDTIQSLQIELKDNFDEHIDSYISDKHVLDIMPKNISKGNALKQLLSELNVSTDEIACIGDSYNDIPMFHLTPYSFAMSKADQAVKDEATYVVDSVHDAIHKVLDINETKQR
jgi:Cof subfamily protein (haloacid dehalogenase superfamily)